MSCCGKSLAAPASSAAAPTAGERRRRRPPLAGSLAMLVVIVVIVVGGASASSHAGQSCAASSFGGEDDPQTCAWERPARQEGEQGRPVAAPAPPPPPPPPPPASAASAAPSADGVRYIVRMCGYRPVDEVRRLLEEAVGPPSTGAPFDGGKRGGSAGEEPTARPPLRWRWIERRNPAMAFPTDFALVELPSADDRPLLEALLSVPASPAASAGLGGVWRGAPFSSSATAAKEAAQTGNPFRDVHPDRRMTATVKWVPESGPLRDAVLSDAHLAGGRGLLQQPDAPPGAPPPPPPPGGRLERAPAPERGPADDLAARAAAGPRGSAGGQQQQQQEQEQQQQGGGSQDANADGADEDDAPPGGGVDPTSVFYTVKPRRGRFTTRPTMGLEDDGPVGGKDELRRKRRRALQQEQAAAQPPVAAAAAVAAAAPATTAPQPPMTPADKEAAAAVQAVLDGTAEDDDASAGGGERSGEPAIPDPDAAAANKPAAAAPPPPRPPRQAGDGAGGGHRGGGGAGAGKPSVPDVVGARAIWAQGHTGRGVRVGVFDTGIREGHPHVRNIRERTNWTSQDSLSDGLGHGSFVAGVILSSDDKCPGVAPDAELYTYKVFTDDQLSYTSWFLDAFNHAMDVPVHVINLSIGGPDHLDQPFVDKVLEVTARGALLVSAIGNDGPLYGTLNNPADQPDVIGVGGVDRDGALAPFSSRGMSTWELPQGTGRAKPDVVAWARDVPGSRMDTGCRALSGTSVASPVVAGCVALLASTVPEHKRWGPQGLLNPASMKQALVEGARRVAGANQFEQGAGRVALAESQALLATAAADGAQPRASLHPAKIDLTDCPYAWPYCKQPLSSHAMPVVVNATILNPLGPVGRVVGVPTFSPSSSGGEGGGDGGRFLHVSFTWSETLWPWSGHLSVHVEVSPEARNFTGPATGTIRFTVESPAPQQRPASVVGGGAAGNNNGTAPSTFATNPSTGQPVRTSVVEVPFVARIAPTPPRHRRVLWDVLHSIRYPPGYLPRDNLDVRGDILDWHGDHPFTNYHETLDALLDAGMSVEVLASPSTCFDARNYGALLSVDAEDEWYPEEREKLARDVREHGLALVVFAEWYNAASIGSMRFYDDNTRSWWLPATGGGNVPAINELLAAVGGEAPAEKGQEEEGGGGDGVTTAAAVPAGPAIAFGDAIITGDAKVAGMSVNVAYGASIARMPAGSWLHRAPFADHAGTPLAAARAAFGLGPGGDGGPGGEDGGGHEGAAAAAAAPGAAAGRRRRRRLHLDGGGGGGGGGDEAAAAAARPRQQRKQRQQQRRRRQRQQRRRVNQDAGEDPGADGEPQDLPVQQKEGEHGVLGVARVGKGSVALFGDSNCLDASHATHRCHDLLLALLRRYAGGAPEAKSRAAAPALEDEAARLPRQYTSSRWAATAAAAAPLAKAPAAAAAAAAAKKEEGAAAAGADAAAAALARFAGPARRPGASFDAVSFVRRRPHQCYMSAPCAFRARVGGPGAEGREEAATTDGWACPLSSSSAAAAEEGGGGKGPWWARTSLEDDGLGGGGGEAEAKAKAAAEAEAEKHKAAAEAAAAAAAEAEAEEKKQKAAAAEAKAKAKPWAEGGSSDAAVRAPQATAGGEPEEREQPEQQQQQQQQRAEEPKEVAVGSGGARPQHPQQEQPAGRLSAALPSILGHALNAVLAICMVGGGAMAVLAWGRRARAAGGGGFAGGAGAGAGGAGGGAAAADSSASLGRAGGRFNFLRRTGASPGSSIAMAERATADERALLRGGSGGLAGGGPLPPGLGGAAAAGSASPPRAGSSSRGVLDV